MEKLAEVGQEVRISQKLSAKDFVSILERRPSKIVVSASILKQSKNIGLIVDALETAASKGVPKIEVVSRGKPPRRIEQDWVDPYIRSLVGHRADSKERLLVHLLDLGKNGAPISELPPGEIELLPKLNKINRVEITSDLRVRLTKLGTTIAQGAKKLYPELR
ncbi:unnamed protein product [marine sediment metagenome]|uniref:Uncharacterized protein n=1 Tax=marine sediment metagenome TaxID=412755 RepID=X1B394_9ZZZZ